MAGAGTRGSAQNQITERATLPRQNTAVASTGVLPCTANWNDQGLHRKQYLNREGIVQKSNRTRQCKPTEKHSEKQIQTDILLRLSGTSEIRLFRNNVGVGYTRVGTPIRFGLRPGSADLIGWRSITITPDMIGRRVAVFLSVETKTEDGDMRPDQINWRQQVELAGGIACISRSVVDALDAVFHA